MAPTAQPSSWVLQLPSRHSPSLGTNKGNLCPYPRAAADHPHPLPGRMQPPPCLPLCSPAGSQALTPQLWQSQVPQPAALQLPVTASPPQPVAWKKAISTTHTSQLAGKLLCAEPVHADGHPPAILPCGSATKSAHAGLIAAPTVPPCSSNGGAGQGWGSPSVSPSDLLLLPRR